jgi:CheY-like chemotaxis protein
MPPAYKNLVMADDDEDDVQLFQEALAESCSDHNLTIAADGAKLIKLLEVIPTPDVILLDLNMPLKSGKECLEEIRANDKFDNVPVVILSTSSQDADIQDCFKKGADHYFVKPPSLDGMKAIVLHICTGSFTNQKI